MWGQEYLWFLLLKLNTYEGGNKIIPLHQEEAVLGSGSLKKHLECLGHCSWAFPCDSQSSGEFHGLEHGVCRKNKTVVTWILFLSLIPSIGT